MRINHPLSTLEWTLSLTTEGAPTCILPLHNPLIPISEWSSQPETQEPGCGDGLTVCLLQRDQLLGCVRRAAAQGSLLRVHVWFKALLSLP